MAARKSEAKDDSEAQPVSDGGVGVEQYFAEQDQTLGSVKNPKRTTPEKGASDLITSVEACRLINGHAGYLMYNPKGLYRDAGKRAPAVHEVRPGEMRFSRDECETFVLEWVDRKSARARLKAEEERFAREQREFSAASSPTPRRQEFEDAIPQQDPQTYARS